MQLIKIIGKKCNLQSIYTLTGLKLFRVSKTVSTFSKNTFTVYKNLLLIVIVPLTTIL